MIRSDEDFEALVGSMEWSARMNPARHRVRVAFLAALGYVYVVGLLVVLLAMLFFAVVYGRFLWLGAVNPVSLRTAVAKPGIFLVIIGLIGAIRVVIDSLIIDIPKPLGAELRRDAAPKLFQLIDEISSKFDTPRFDHVFLDSSECNAAVSQYALFGLFGPTTNYLIIGIPLLKALTPNQFQSVLAHELGHISRNHCRLGNWLYQLNKTWETLRAGLNNDNRKLIASFVRWYAPYFSAYTFVLRRADEFGADRYAAQLFGKEARAESIVAVRIRMAYLTYQFWPSIIERTNDAPEPDVRPMTMLFTGNSSPSREDEERYYRRALDETSGISDTHPCLTERLASLGYQETPAGRNTPGGPPIPLPPFPNETAAEVFLGNWVVNYSHYVDEEWKNRITPMWKKYHAGAQLRRSQEAAAAAGEGVGHEN